MGGHGLRVSCSFVLLLSLILSCISFGGQTSGFAGLGRVADPGRISVTSYAPHAPIVIDSNDDFLSQGWPGSGTPTDPYVIEGLDITSSDTCIRISGTTAYFEIRNCLISSSTSSMNDGVVLSNAVHGVIRDCVIGEHFSGVRVDNSPGTILINNTATDNRIGFLFQSSDSCTVTNSVALQNELQGFYVRESDSCSLTNNTSTANWAGFFLFASTVCTLAHNVALGDDYGFYFESSHSCILRGNSASYCNYDGFFIQTSDLCTLVENSASYNARDGFNFESCDFLTVSNTTVSYNAGSGFYFESSDSCTLIGCTATHNGVGSYLSQSKACALMNNTFLNNGVVMSGPSVHDWLHDIEHNMINGKSLGYFRDLAGELVDGSQYGQIIVANCSGLTVINGTFANASVGIQVGFSTGCTLYELEATYNSLRGIYLESSESCCLSWNTVTNNSIDGIVLHASRLCKVFENTVTHNQRLGVYLWGNSSYNLLFVNVIGHNGLSNAHDNGTANSWDDCISKGNRWSDYSGSGSYSVPGSAGSVDRYPLAYPETEPPIIDHPDDIQYEYGTSGNRIVWIIQEASPVRYVVYLDGEYLEYDDSWDGSPVIIDVDGLDPWTHNFTLVVYDEFGNWASDTVLVTVVDTTPPTIDHPDDIQFEYGTSGHRLTWTVYEATLKARYEIYLHESLFEEHDWTGLQIVIDLDDLDVGIHNFTLVVYDGSGNWASDTVFVTVVDTTPPTIDHPDDIQFEYGTFGHRINWSAEDARPSRYEVFLDGVLFYFDDWYGGNIVVNADGLEIGTHNYTIVVYDASDQWAADTVLVTVTSAMTGSIVTSAVLVVVVTFLVVTVHIARRQRP
ncbi:MAG: NosD domain-containing protein [Candidatus Thorarchaeota archaeon]